MHALVFLAALPLVACSGGARDGTNQSTAAGPRAERSYPVAGFTGIELTGPDDVDVRVGSAFSVRAEGPVDVLDRLDIRTSGTTLTIGRQRSDGGWTSSSKGVKVYVTMPAIAAASLTGSGDLSVDRVTGGNFTGSIAGSGDLKLGQVTADALRLDIQGSGDISVAGQAKTLVVEVAGSGNVAGKGLKASGADVTVAGSGNVEAAVAGDAKVELMGSGDIDLGRDARCRTTKGGSGEVRCG